LAESAAAFTTSAIVIPLPPEANTLLPYTSNKTCMDQVPLQQQEDADEEAAGEAQIIVSAGASRFGRPAAMLLTQQLPPSSLQADTGSISAKAATIDSSSGGGGVAAAAAVTVAAAAAAATTAAASTSGSLLSRKGTSKLESTAAAAV